MIIKIDGCELIYDLLLRQSARAPHGGSAANPNRQDTVVGEVYTISLSAAAPVYSGFLSVGFFPHVGALKS